MENGIFEASYLYWIYISKIIKTCPNHHTDFLRFLFTEDYLKIKIGLELVSRPHFSQNLFIKKFLLKYYINQNFITRLCLLPKLISKMCFMLRHLMTSWHLNFWKVKVWLSQEWEELWSEIKLILPCFTSAIFKT